MNRRRAWFLGGGALVVALLVAVVLVFFERVEIEIETGYSGAARTNPLYACQQLLTRLGIPARSVSGTGQLPPPDHVLVLVAPRQVFGETRAKRLLEWVAAGGHLIVTPRLGTAEGRDDPLLSPLGLSVEPREGEGDEKTVRVRAYPDARAAEVAVALSQRLEGAADQALFVAGAEDANLLARYGRGEGFVTVLADAAFLGNAEIGERDHARFTWELVCATSRPAGVWLVFRDDVPSLGSMLVRRAWMALVSAAALLAAWLWRRGRRFGPLLEAPPSGRRSLAEHIRATGEFLWSQGEYPSLVASQRQAVLRQIERRRPAWLRLSKRERVRDLAELAGVPAGVLASALEGRPQGDEAEFVRMISTLEKVRRAL